MKLKIEIQLDNEAMQDTHDIAKALREVALALEGDCGGARGPSVPLPIRDTNGNHVGEWKIIK